MSAAKFLTIRQPFASLIAVGAKTVATRSRSTQYRGPLAIHAGATMNGARRGGWADKVGDWMPVQYVDGTWKAEHYARGEHGAPEDIPLPLGAVVAVCDLVDVVPIEVGYPSIHEHGPTFGAPNLAQRDHPRPTLGLWYCTHDGMEGYEGKASRCIEAERSMGDYTQGRYGWVLDNVRPVDPVPMKGAQGLRDLPDDVAAVVLGAEQ